MQLVSLHASSMLSQAQPRQLDVTEKVPLTPSAALPVAPGGLLAQKQKEGWSPSKIESLNHFLATTSKAGAATLPLSTITGSSFAHDAEASAGPSGTGPAQQMIPALPPSVGGEAPRPYLGLKYLLRSGPGGSGIPKTWTEIHGGGMSSGGNGKAQLPSSGRAPAPPGGRFAPYSLPPPRAARRLVWGK